MPTVFLPVYMPNPVYRQLQKLRRALTKSPRDRGTLNIRGERDVEWSFLSREIPNGEGQALDFGCEHGYMSLMAAQKGFDVLALDLEEQKLLWRHPRVTFRQGDFLELNLPENHFDLIVNCSSVEHVGIVGRYGIAAERDNGDLEVMQRFARVLKSDGLLVMTAPCGRDAILAPWCRVYGRDRLQKLFERFEILKENYWTKNADNLWTESQRESALAFQPIYHPSDPHSCVYALGCFVLRKRT